MSIIVAPKASGKSRMLDTFQKSGYMSIDSDAYGNFLNILIGDSAFSRYIQDLIFDVPVIDVQNLSRIFHRLLATNYNSLIGKIESESYFEMLMTVYIQREITKSTNGYRNFSTDDISLTRAEGKAVIADFSKSFMKIANDVIVGYGRFVTAFRSIAIASGYRKPLILAVHSSTEVEMVQTQTRSDIVTRYQPTISPISTIAYRKRDAATGPLQYLAQVLLAEFYEENNISSYCSSDSIEYLLFFKENYGLDLSFPSW